MAAHQQDPDPRGTLVAAEIAVDEDDLDTAEDAILKALSEVRKARQN